MKLKPNEKLEDLGYNGLQIIQSETEYRFTTDAVLLANAVGDLTGKRAVDLGTGSGIIAVLLATKKNAKHVWGVELQPQLADMAQRTVQHNKLDNVTIVNCPMQDAYKSLGGDYDCVVCNPPYRKCGSGERQLAPNLALCRHEIAVTLEGVIVSAKRLLNTKGSLYLVHQAERLAEICYLMKQNGIEPKVITPIAPRVDAQPNLVIVKGVLCGNVGCTVSKTLEILDEKGNYTPQVAAFYGTESNKGEN